MSTCPPIDHMSDCSGWLSDGSCCGIADNHSRDAGYQQGLEWQRFGPAEIAAQLKYWADDLDPERLPVSHTVGLIQGLVTALESALDDAP